MKKFPFKEDIQRGILYLYKNHEDFHNEIDPLISAGYFEYPIHQKLYRLVRDYKDKYAKLPTDIILTELIDTVRGDDELKSDYEDELGMIGSMDVSNVDNPSYYLDMIEKWAKEQSMVEAIKQSMIYLKEGNIDGILDAVKKASLVTRNVREGVDFFDSPVDRWNDDDKYTQRYPCIFPTVDASLDGGLEAGEMGVYVAPPGVGKSLGLANTAFINLANNQKVLYWSGEMAEKKIAMRMDSITTMLSRSEIKMKPLSFSKRMDLFREKFPEGDLRIHRFISGQANCNNLRALLTQLRNKYDFVPSIVIVDYLELLRPVMDCNAEYMAQQMVARELRALAQEFNVVLWTATQTNREGARVRVITDTELGDSYGKIREADLGISFNQTLEEYEAGVMRGYILKARDARCRYSLQMIVDYNTLRMGERGELPDETEE